MIRVRVLVAIVAALLLLAAGCSDEESSDTPVVALDDDTTDDSTTVAADDEPAEDEDAGFDDDLACGEEALSEDGSYELVSANEIVDGELGPVCYGEEDDPVLLDAWQILADIVPPGEREDLGVFAGFDSNEGGDEVTVAFVNFLGEGDQFQMSVNLAESEVDPDALVLTLVHEFGHVLTQTEDQLDFETAPEDCETFYNGVGCFTEGSLMADWVEQFWGDQADEVDPLDTSVEGGSERCAVDPGFFGPYAASAPEEDFAESLSAFVLQVPAESEEQQARLDFFEEHPELVEQRDRAEEAGYGPFDADAFEACGTG